MHTFRRVYYILFILQTLAWTSCQKNMKPSILVIAVDRLSNDFTTCSDDNLNLKSGLNLLCKESVRFTHSHTTSTQPAAAIGSLLTGLYPMDHHLYRSYDRIRPHLETLPKIAKENNYVTSFFSGSPSLLKKTGLSDYFDLFDDSIASSATEYEVDFKQQALSFIQWKKINKNPFLSFIYNSELSKINTLESDQSTFEKIDEKLFNFFIELKKDGTWDASYIILVGLNGYNKFGRIGVNNLNNLHNENTNIATLIKAPRNKGDEGVYWKNDLKINLADIGKTLSCVLKKCTITKNKTDSNFLPVLNLAQLWSDKNNSENQKNYDRVSVVQSTAHDMSHSYSILYDNYNYIQNKDQSALQHLLPNVRIYNTLTDKSEITNLLNKDFILPSEISNTIRILDTVKNSQYISAKVSNFDLTQNPLYIYEIQKQIRAKKFDNKILKLKNDITSNNICAALTAQSKITKEDLKNCNDDLFLQYILYIRSTDLGLNSDKNKLLYSLMKIRYKDYLHRLSVNLSHNNIWGLSQPNQVLVHPLVFIDPTFFEN